MKECWAGSMKQLYDNERYIFISIALSHFKLYNEELSALIIRAAQLLVQMNIIINEIRAMRDKYSTKCLSH